MWNVESDTYSKVSKLVLKSVTVIRWNHPQSSACLAVGTLEGNVHLYWSKKETVRLSTPKFLFLSFFRSSFLVLFFFHFPIIVAAVIVVDSVWL